MPGCCPPRSVPFSDNVRPLYPQALESTGLKSFLAQPDNVSSGSKATASARAISAWHAAAAERRRRTDWLAIGLAHNSSHLFARLPFGDAVRLAALVGTGQMAWAEINAALDAKIKMAIADERGGRDRLSPGPFDVWEQARRTAEEDIWARYHAKCDAVFADDIDEPSTDPWSREGLRDRERALGRLRDERDRALAALGQRMDPPQARLEMAAQARVHLTATEHNALRKLDASGFAGSTLMADAIRDLASPTAGSPMASA